MRLKFSMLFILLLVGFGNISYAQFDWSLGDEQALIHKKVPCDSFPDPKPILTTIMLESGFTKPGEIIITEISAQYRKKFILFSKITRVRIVAKKYPGGGITYFVRIITVDGGFQLETADSKLAINVSSIFHCKAGLK
jgi:hypothetical protein